MWPGKHAANTPDKPAIIMAATGETVTYKELNDRSNQLAQLFSDAGLRFGDHIAVLMDNNPRYLEVCWAAQRSGLFYTALNWHFTAEEAAYILDDCDAEVIVVSEGTRELAEQIVDLMPKVRIRLAVGNGAGPSTIAGYVDYEDAIAGFPPEPIAEELEGTPMLYSSGTTGRPKGIKYHIERMPIGSAPERLAALTTFFGFDDSSVYLSPAPLYHSAPLFYCMSTLRLGATVVMMEQFDPLLALEYIERYRVTQSQWVPTMFVRMWKLSEEERNRYDLSSHRNAVHAAAPCPVDVKRRMIEWWGPIIMEYYSSTEGAGATIIDAEDWLAHPGSVGRSMLGPIHIVGDDGALLPPGEIGVVWFQPREGSAGFEYHKDPEKTRDSMNDRGWSTVGDMGYLDQDGYLYLTDRKTFMIVSGGVNIYPQEAENVLVDHPKVLDVAVFGVPNDEMGEEVKAVVQPIDWADAGPDLERELLEYCRGRLAHYKCPRSVDFERELPRQQTGKLYKRLLRDRYWGQRDSRIV
ncbi:MAG: long-chain acyl-CoA synthetase [Actinomycetota bacterium]|nr:long-chain acyl-CoA synthetase [Actinomycetota bacterium]